MLLETGISILIGGVIWLAGFMMQRFSLRNRIKVPSWLSCLTGSPANSLDPKAFSVQLFCLGLTLWFILLIFIDPNHKYRSGLAQLGFIILLIVAITVNIILDRLAKRR